MIQKTLDFNKLVIETDTDEGKMQLENTSISWQDPKFDKIDVIFRDIETRLIEMIGQFKHGAIFGCVAWLTSPQVLNALAECPNVQILVQKEDFLRQETDSDPNTWKALLHNNYDKLHCDLSHFDMMEPICELSIGQGQEEMQSIRCVGNQNSDKKMLSPRSHHKFLVFCEFVDDNVDSAAKLAETELREIAKKHLSEQYNEKTLAEMSVEDIMNILYRPGETDDSVLSRMLELYNQLPRNMRRYIPVAVWTGSFNFTKTASFSFENVIMLHDKSGTNPVLNAYLKEHHQIYALSEPLDWTSKWVAPEFRIGT